MLKSVLHIALSSILIFTILAPPILSLLDIEVTAITMQEEKKEKEEKELEEKTILFHGFSAITSIHNCQNNVSTSYREDLSDCTSKIVLPPPEFRA